MLSCLGGASYVFLNHSNLSWCNEEADPRILVIFHKNLIKLGISDELPMARLSTKKKFIYQ